MESADFTEDLNIPKSYEPPKKEDSNTKSKQKAPISFRPTRENEVRLVMIEKHNPRLSSTNATINFCIEFTADNIELMPKIEAAKVLYGEAKHGN